MFYFGGGYSADYNIVVERYPKYSRPARRVDTVTVPGRNGALTISDGAYDNVIQEFEIYLNATADGLPAVAAAAADWLLGTGGYQRLESDYEPDVYRMARCTGPLELENILNRYGRATLAFDCRPERWLLSGEQTQSFKANGVLHNPTRCTARPLLRVWGTGTLTLNGAACKINTNDNYLDIDCESMQVYRDGVNHNRDVLIRDFPALGAGENILILDGVTRADVTPRWWTL